MSLSPRSTRQQVSAGSDDGRRDLLLAWASLVLLLGSIIGGVLIMNSLTWDPSFWVSALVLVDGLVVVLLFAGGAILFGRRAMGEGEDAGRIPVAIGGTIGGLSFVWVLIPIVAHLAGFE
jgi:hypothetical protein